MLRVLLLPVACLSVILPGPIGHHYATARSRPLGMISMDASANRRPTTRRAVRYITAREMEANVQEAAREMGFDEGQALMLGSCGRNIYAMGCGYHMTTRTILEEICSNAADEPWALLLQRCMDGSMPRLRSEATASARMAAARAAAARRRGSGRGAGRGSSSRGASSRGAPAQKPPR